MDAMAVHVVHAPRGKASRPFRIWYALYLSVEALLPFEIFFCMLDVWVWLTSLEVFAGILRFHKTLCFLFFRCLAFFGLAGFLADLPALCLFPNLVNTLFFAFPVTFRTRMEHFDNTTHLFQI